MAPVRTGDESPCRWAAFLEDCAENGDSLVKLPPSEQRSRGNKLLQMLQVPEDRRQLDQLRDRRGEDDSETDEDEELDVQMTIRRTFIELVSPPTKVGRSRALSDSAVLLRRKSLDSDISDSEASLFELSESSTAYTATSPEATDVAPAQWNDWTTSDLPAPYDMASSSSEMVWTPMDPVPPSQWWFPMSCEGTSSSPYCEDTAFVVNPYEWQQWTTCGVEEAVAGQWCIAEDPAVDPSWTPSATASTPTPPSEKTTVMLRNLPTTFTRASLVELLEDEGFGGCFDFLYLPIDFGSRSCLGYAFANFLSASDAARCWTIFDGFTEWGFTCDKVCEVVWGDPHQGFAAHIERYRNSPVMHESVPDDWKPAAYSDGVQVPFPPPTKAIKAPKMRSRPKGPAVAAAAAASA
eukprot:TRINITY_DN1050_c0_g1_i1.p1 TRINITY_DN1050_c0_g1~~TRINITY_DN1050_c0_g1_i1.p1  ORF type:complete len:408 (-),score=89.18 TRINITY_DN1050_c0_g1_i1:48-1271(-)